MKKALIILAQGFEETEAIAPIDILRRAKVEVTVAGLSSLVVEGSRKIKVQADCLLSDAKATYDALILPGGSLGAENLASSQEVARLIRDTVASGRVLAAICASPALVVAPTGVLDGKRATCYPGMESDFPPAVKASADPVVVDGNIITSRGVGTAIAFALAVAEKLVGKSVADSVKRDAVIG